MNALQTPKPLEARRRVSSKHLKLKQRPSYLGMTLEVFLKVMVNGLLSAAAIAALMELLPYHISQKTKLQEIRQEVYKTQKQLKDLRKKFDVSFNDPKGAMADLTPMRPQNQLRVIFNRELINDL